MVSRAGAVGVEVVRWVNSETFQHGGKHVGDCFWAGTRVTVDVSHRRPQVFRRGESEDTVALNSAITPLGARAANVAGETDHVTQYK